MRVHVNVHQKTLKTQERLKYKLYILMWLGLHRINLTLKRKKCHFRNEHCLNVKYPVTKKKKEKETKKKSLQKMYF